MTPNDAAHAGSAAHAVSATGPAVHKFGGSSLADAGCFRRVAGILALRHERPLVVVVSAMRGVTDALIGANASAARGDGDWRVAVDQLEHRHRETIDALFGADAGSLPETIAGEFTSLREWLNALAVLAIPSPAVVERVEGLGEVWSARILSALLARDGAPCGMLDARDVLVMAHAELGPVIDRDASRGLLARWRESHPEPRVVVTGFVARTADGRPTVLGRNGSDYSAAAFADLLDARELTIWGDTDGVLSADPNLVPEAVTLPALSYHEACELAYFGAKVIHPQTMVPVIARDLPVRLRNTFAPAHAGTLISAETAPSTRVKGLSAMRALAVLNLEGSGLIGVPGTAQRIFGALRDAGVSVVMISQGSSEHSICCIVRAADAERALAAANAAFEPELAHGKVQSITLTGGIAVLAAIGDGMAGTPGVAACLFGALARAGVNVRAIAQGASERNISVAIDEADAARALRAAHAAFWLSPQTLGVGVIGPGNVGGVLVDQMLAARERLLADTHLDLRLRAIANSRALLVDDDGRDGHDWRARLRDAGPVDPAAFTSAVRPGHLPHAVIVDCSASPAVADRYADWLAAGIHVITPNKHAGSGPLERWHAIRASAARSGARFRYEATVGAGLPIIQTLRDLLDTGDELVAIDGVLSGTLAWLFNRYDGTRPFSELVREARALGYTEPDPRDDLSGTDVARKLVILAREAGQELSLADVTVASLVPAELADVSIDAFLSRLGALDAEMANRHAHARAAGNVLRHVAHLDADGHATIGVTEWPASHAFAHLHLTDNIVQFTTRRYRDNPLVVQGPGAGPEVTAAGVFADLLRLAAHLGARL